MTRPDTRVPDTARPTRSTRASDTGAFVRTCLAFVACGMLTTWVGPLMPRLRLVWAADESALGRLFLLQFLAFVVANVVSGPIVARVAPGRVLVIAYAVAASSAWHLAHASSANVAVAVLLLGGALGLIVPSATLIATASEQTRTRRMAIINVAWASGAALWPLLVLTTPLPDIRMPLLTLCGIAVAASLLSLGTSSLALSSGRARVAALAPASDAPWRAFIIFGTALLLYGVVEQSVGGWSATWLARHASGASVGNLSTSAYWIALALGRLLLPTLVGWWHERGVCVSALLVAGVGLGMLLWQPATGAPLWMALVGLGFAPVFPLIVGGSTPHFGTWATALTGPLIAVGGVGGAVGPWLVGVVASHASLALGLGVVVVALILLVGAVAISLRPIDTVMVVDAR